MVPPFLKLYLNALVFVSLASLDTGGEYLQTRYGTRVGHHEIETFLGSSVLTKIIGVKH